jgi:hypothetical protein
MAKNCARENSGKQSGNKVRDEMTRVPALLALPNSYEGVNIMTSSNEGE